LRDVLKERSPEEVERIRRDGARFRRAIELTSYDAPEAKEHGGKGILAPDQVERAIDLLIEICEMQRSALRMTGSRSVAATGS
jgi:hypothetical protein